MTAYILQLLCVLAILLPGIMVFSFVAYNYLRCITSPPLTVRPTMFLSTYPENDE